MKNNKHPHHDLIVEWAKDTSKQPQIKKLANDSEWEDCRIHAVISNPNFLARLKPREFIKGHWYPCLNSDEVVRVCIFNGSLFFGTEDCMTSVGYPESDYVEIGESLGEIKLGDEL